MGSAPRSEGLVLLLQGPWIERQALHAAELEVEHPCTGKALRFTAPLQDDMKQLLQVAGLT